MVVHSFLSLRYYFITFSLNFLSFYILPNINNISHVNISTSNIIFYNKFNIVIYIHVLKIITGNAMANWFNAVNYKKWQPAN